MTPQAVGLPGLTAMPWNSSSPFCADDVEGEVALADRAAAGEHEDVVVEAPVHGAAELVEVVGGGGQRRRDPAVLADEGAEGEPVDVVDLAGPERPARRRDLAAGGQEGDARPGIHLDRGDAEGGDRAEPAGGQHVARLQQRGAPGDVGAAAPDVLPGVDGHEDGDVAGAAAVGLLDHDHGVGAVGHRRPGGDLRALARLEGAGGDVAGVHRLDAVEPPRVRPARPEGALGHHRVAVHGGAVERRHVLARRHRGGEHAPHAGVQLDPLGPVEGPGGLVGQPQGLLDGDGLAYRPHLGSGHGSSPPVPACPVMFQSARPRRRPLLFIPESDAPAKSPARSRGAGPPGNQSSDPLRGPTVPAL